MGIITRASLALIALVSIADARGHKHARALTSAKHHSVHQVATRAEQPWHGHLSNAAQFPDGDGYHIRRPWRSYGTARTVELTHEVVEETIAELPDHHVLAIGDFSAEHGGRITEHASHQTGHDVDIGLYYNEKPANYPASFVSATEDNLDCEATYKLLDNFVRTQDKPGGASIIFLDFRVQGLLYDWARENGVSEERLDRIFQYPHGKSSSAGFVRHWPNHDNHIHVRFR